MQLGTGSKWSPLIASATGIPYSLGERMGGRTAPGSGVSPEKGTRG